MADFQETCFGRHVNVFYPLFILHYSGLQIIIIIEQPLEVINDPLLLSMWRYVCRCLVNQPANSVFKLILDKATGDHTNILGLSNKVCEI